MHIKKITAALAIAALTACAKGDAGAPDTTAKTDTAVAAPATESAVPTSTLDTYRAAAFRGA